MNQKLKSDIIDAFEYAPYFYMAAIFFLLAMLFGAMSLYELEKTKNINNDYSIITSIASQEIATQGSYYLLCGILSIVCALITRLYILYWTINYKRVLKNNNIDVIE